jgi:hypothetical protein
MRPHEPHYKRGWNAIVAMPIRENDTPSQSQPVDVIPSTAQSQTKATAI